MLLHINYKHLDEFGYSEMATNMFTPGPLNPWLAGTVMLATQRNVAPGDICNEKSSLNPFADKTKISVLKQL
jgi:hypothetical protein